MKIKYLRRTYFPYLLAPLVVLLFFVIFSPRLFAATTYTVTNNNDSGAGSLRQAIADANSNAGADQIDFAISGAGPHTIVLTTGGITITDQVKVNGLSQSGSICNGTSSTLKVVIEGSGIGVAGAGANGTEINGLVFGAGTSVGISSNSNTIRCNFFGTTANGSIGVGDINSQSLVIYNNSAEIGGNSSSDMNLFGRYRFIIAGSSNHIIKNNLIGTDITGMNSLGSNLSFYSGVYNNITISHNVISKIGSYYTTFNNFTLSANKIGTNFSGTAAIFGDIGTLLSSKTEFNNTTIGGATEADGNLISGAVIVDTNEWGHGIVIGGANNTIQNNKIGVNADATAVIGNGYEGISIECANNCTNTQVLDNIIGGSYDGIRVTDGSGNTNNNNVNIKRNYIGTNKAQNIDLGNRVAGIRIDGNMGNVLIGGTNTADKNVIANNKVGIYSVATNHNTFLGNTIYNNDDLGIAFNYYNSNDSTENDPGDIDTGANDLLNFPIITQAAESMGNTTIGYSLDVPAGDYRIEFFSNSSADPSGYGEGQTFIGYDDVSSDGSGNQTFVTSVSGVGFTHLAATSTQKDSGSPTGFGPTSEFGNFEPQADLSVSSDDGTTAAVYGSAHQYTFTVTNNGLSDVDHFVFSHGSDVVDSPLYTVGSSGSTATTTGSFSGTTWSGLLKSGETLTFILAGNINGTGTLSTTNICIDQDSTLQMDGQTVTDPVSNNNCGTDNDTIVPVPTTDLSIIKTINAPGIVINGHQVTYTLTITNNGPMSHTYGTAIYDLIPLGTTFNSSSGDKLNCTDIGPSSGLGDPGIPDGGIVACTDESSEGIANGESTSVQIVLDVISIDETQSITNYAAIINPYDNNYDELISSYMLGENFFALQNNSIAHATYDPNSPLDDGDGISSSVENAAPNSGDANNDGTADSEQANVASFVDPVSGEYAVLQVNNECSITNVSTAAESANTTQDTNFSYPTGLMDFALDCGTPGTTATVTQYYYGATGNFAVRKYNPNNQTYQTIDSASISNQTIGGKSAKVATYQVNDGGSLDLDGTEDGNIHDPAGLAQTTGSLADTGQNTHQVELIAITLFVSGLTIAVYSFKKQRRNVYVPSKK